jgi:hypothetical protein
MSTIRENSLTPNSAKISGFVITYNSGPFLATCLRSLRFVDELIVVDKSSTDATPAIAARWSDRVITVPWSPLPTETRLVAHDACSHDFIIFLDHDECLNIEGIRWVKEQAGSHPAQVFRFPKVEYIMGLHDPDAYYWPMRNVRAFRRGAAEFVRTLHEEVRLRVPESQMFDIPCDTGVRIHNLSHKNVHQWIEKTNRYTDAPDRVSSGSASTPLESFGQERIEHWLSQSRSRTDGVVAAALLRAVYDIVDRVKQWETSQGLDGDALFAAVRSEMEATYDTCAGELGLVFPTTPHQRKPPPVRPWAKWRGVLKRLARRPA